MVITEHAIERCIERGGAETRPEALQRIEAVVTRERLREVEDWAAGVEYRILADGIDLIVVNSAVVTVWLPEAVPGSRTVTGKRQGSSRED